MEEKKIAAEIYIDDGDEDDRFNSKMNMFYLLSFLAIIGIAIFSLFFAKRFAVSQVEEYGDMEF
jgi:hypothetical protein